MINYTNPQTGYTIEEKEVNESLTKLAIFCQMNVHIPQAVKFNNKITAIEKALAAKKFKN